MPPPNQAKVSSNFFPEQAPGHDKLKTAISATIAHYELLTEQPAPLILMVSGGSDSVALACLLAPLLAPEIPTILHINHQLRGQDADGDELFVAQLAEGLGLPFVARRVDVAKRAAATGDNLEQAGRVVRYEAANGLLDELCAQRGCPPEAGRIATAHTLDDRAETFLMRTIVGGGTGSLASIPYRNGRVIRPLLSCTRSELRTWLQSKRPAPQWREDASNADTAHLRAFVRHEVIPLLKTRNPDLLHTLADSMDALAGDERHLAAKAAQAAARHLHVDDIPPAPLATLDAVALEEPPAIARRVVRMACQRVMPPGARLTFEHVDAIVNCGAHVGFATDIPGDVTVRNVYGTLVFRRKTVDERPAHKGSC